MRSPIQIFALLLLPLGLHCGSSPEPDPFVITSCEKNFLTTGACPGDRGCAWTGLRWRSIEVDGRCAAFAKTDSACIEAGQCMNNGSTEQLYRLVNGHTETAILIDAYERIRGWLEGREFFLRFPAWSCGPEPAACEAQHDAEACGRLGCFWAPGVRIGITEADRCLGWEPEPVSLCLTPNPHYYVDETGNSFQGSYVRRFFYETESGYRLLELAVSDSAQFRSSDSIPEQASWGTCRSSTTAPVCACGD